MTAAPAIPLPSLGEKRGLSQATLDLCSVRSVGNDHAFGAGWMWKTFTLEGVQAWRWKSLHSQRPPDTDNWAKYRWHPKKPDGNASWFDPDHKLRAAVKAEAGCLYIVGGEIAAMSMFDAGYRNTTCFFGDESIPRETLLIDLSRLGAVSIVMIPDRDHSGQDCAVTVRDLITKDVYLDFTCLALPYEVTDKHGKDVNDWWIDLQATGKKLKVSDLPIWRLPEPKPVVIDFPRWDTSFEDLPPRFVEDILRDVQSRAPQNKPFNWSADGWSNNIRCPFHDDTEASAGFNKESMSFNCFRCGKKSAKEYGEGIGIALKDYYADPIPVTRPSAAASTPIPRPSTKPALAPSLPTYAQLSPNQITEAARGRGWLDSYLSWARQSCPLAPDIFHEAMALWLLATVSTRRMHMRIGGEEIFPNLYVLVIAKTSVYRKSTAMNTAKKLLKAAGLESLLLPTDVTPEALFDELAGVKPINFDSLSADDKRDWLLGRAVAAQRSFIKDECSSIFANLKREYNAGLTELLLEGYDGSDGKLKKLLKSKGLISVKDMCLSFLGATTPAMYAKYVGNDEQENGFVARFAMITPEEKPIYKVVEDYVPVPQPLVQQLRKLFLDILPWHGNQRPGASAVHEEVLTPPVMTVTMDSDAVKQLNIYTQALNSEVIEEGRTPEQKVASTTRLATMAKKIAMLLAAIESNISSVRVEPRHVYAAQLICERWRESLYRLDRDIAHAAENGNDKLLTYLQTVGDGGATVRDIMRDCAFKQRYLVDEMLKTLWEAGRIEKFDHKPEKGRPSIRFKIT